MIKTGNPIISIYTEETPNPGTMKFVVNKLLYPGKSADFPDEGSAAASPLAGELFTFPFVKGVFIASNFVTLTKTPETEWYDVIPSIKTFLREYIEEGRPVVDEDELATQQAESIEPSSGNESEVEKRIKELLKNYVQPAVEMDGGNIRFKHYDRGKLTVMLQGACSGCPSARITLKAGVENMMKRMIPEVREVVAEMD
ncbi:MAG: NifU family protein [Chitinophagaceae bacterium]